MKLPQALSLATLLLLLPGVPAAASIAEHVTGGNLDLVWSAGFDTPNRMYGKTLEPGDPAYANPSGDHTVAVAQNASPDSGGLIVTTVDPGPANADVAWEAWMFTGAGNTRRGIIVRATPDNGFKSFYMLVVESGLFQIRFRKFVAGVPTTIATWFATSLPAGSIPANTWHKLKIVAKGNEFRCFVDDFELTTTPIVDNDVAAGWVGCYNFRFDLGNVPVLFDDLVLSCPGTLAAAFHFTPRALNLRSLGRWVSGVIEPPAPYGPAEVDVASVRLNGAVAVDPAAPSEIGDHDGNGIPDLKIRFRRSEVELTVMSGDSVPVTVSGLVAGTCFEGDDVIRVLRPRMLAPLAGDVVSAGSVAEVRWEVPAGVAVPTVALLSSVDDGATWRIETRGLPNLGSCDWNVPSSPSNLTRVAIVQIESSGAIGDEVEGVLSVSEGFTISAPLAVSDGRVDFGVRPLANPSSGSLRVTFTLPSSAPANLSVFDVSGRVVGLQDVGGLGPGSHAVTLAENAPAGVYLVRLSQAGRGVSTRLTVVR